MTAYYDLHSHTQFSDGADSVQQMIRSAEAASLEAFAITDHSFEDGRLWKSNAPIQDLIRQVEQARTGTLPMLLVGVEGTMLGPHGGVSVSADTAELLDLVLVDLGFLTQGVFEDAPAGRADLVRNALDAVLNACKHPWADVIAHPFNLGRCQPPIDLQDLPAAGLDEVAAAMAETGTAFEVMNQMHYWFPNMPVRRVTDAYTDLVARFASVGVRFVTGGDAHCMGSVGNLTWSNDIIARAGIQAEQLLNPTCDLPLRHWQNWTRDHPTDG